MIDWKVSAEFQTVMSYHVQLVGHYLVRYKFSTVKIILLSCQSSLFPGLHDQSSSAFFTMTFFLPSNTKRWTQTVKHFTAMNQVVVPFMYLHSSNQKSNIQAYLYVCAILYTYSFALFVYLFMFIKLFKYNILFNDKVLHLLNTKYLINIFFISIIFMHINKCRVFHFFGDNVIYQVNPHVRYTLIVFSLLQGVYNLYLFISLCTSSYHIILENIHISFFLKCATLQQAQENGIFMYLCADSNCFRTRSWKTLELVGWYNFHSQILDIFINVFLLA